MLKLHVGISSVYNRQPLKKEPFYHCPLTYSMSGPEKWTPYGLFCPASLTAHIVLSTTVNPCC